MCRGAGAYGGDGEAVSLSMPEAVFRVRSEDADGRGGPEGPFSGRQGRGLPDFQSACGGDGDAQGGGVYNRELQSTQKQFVFQTLREQIYQYLRNQIHSGMLSPGEFINSNEISERIGISKTPLRDALIQLESEGFVTIIPRKGVMVNRLTIEDVRNAWEICRAFEVDMLKQAIPRINGAMLEDLGRINREMRIYSEASDADRFYVCNNRFHEILLHPAGNAEMQRILRVTKQRLYDFLNRTHIETGEIENFEEHEHLIALVREQKVSEACEFMREVHWSFENKRAFIEAFYLGGEKGESAGTAGASS